MTDEEKKEFRLAQMEWANNLHIKKRDFLEWWIDIEDNNY